jgi:hypothetical protein
MNLTPTEREPWAMKNQKAPNHHRREAVMKVAKVVTWVEIVNLPGGKMNLIVLHRKVPIDERLFLCEAHKKN